MGLARDELEYEFPAKRVFPRAVILAHEPEATGGAISSRRHNPQRSNAAVKRSIHPHGCTEIDLARDGIDPTSGEHSRIVSAPGRPSASSGTLSGHTHRIARGTHPYGASFAALECARTETRT